MLDWKEILKNPEMQRAYVDAVDNLIPSLFQVLGTWFLSLREMREIHEAMILDGSSVGYNPYRQRVGLKPLLEMSPRDEDAPRYIPFMEQPEWSEPTCKLFYRPCSYKALIAYMKDGAWVYPHGLLGAKQDESSNHNLQDPE